MTVLKATQIAIFGGAIAAVTLTAACSGSTPAATPGASQPGGAATETPPVVATVTVTQPAASGRASGGSGGGSGAGGTGRCHTGMLSASVRLGSPGAGQRYANLVLTNISSAACTVFGFPGLQLIGAGGGSDQIETQAVRTGPAGSMFTLGPGGSAFSQLHWTVVNAPDEPGTACEPNPVQLLVIPPDETTQVGTSWPGGPVCQHGRIDLTALAPGVGTP